MENWIDVPGFEGLYQVSNLGRVRSLTILTPDMSSHGYPRVTMFKGEYGKKERLRMQVHNIVMLAFVGPPHKGQEVNHKNGVKSDASLENLEYVTKSYNQWHCNYVIKTRESQKGSNHGRSKITEETALAIRAAAVQMPQHEVAAKFGVSKGLVSMIINRKIWKHI